MFILIYTSALSWNISYLQQNVLVLFTQWYDINTVNKKIYKQLSHNSKLPISDDTIKSHDNVTLNDSESSINWKLYEIHHVSLTIPSCHQPGEPSTISESFATNYWHNVGLFILYIHYK